MAVLKGIIMKPNGKCQTEKRSIFAKILPLIGGIIDSVMCRSSDYEVKWESRIIKETQRRS
jgi:hypothetical protein